MDNTERHYINMAFERYLKLREREGHLQARANAMVYSDIRLIFWRNVSRETRERIDAYEKINN